nr:hypothetical protein [uncultured Rhodopila sp.]
MGAPVEKSSKNKGRRGGSLGSFGRLVRGYFEAREVERLAEAEIKYKQEYSNAGTDEDRYKAEQGLQRSVYSAPLVGPVLHALTMFDLPGVKGMLGTEQTMASAQQEAQHTAMLQQQMVFQQDLSRQAGIAQAGGGTDEARRLEIDAENERQQRADKEQINTREKEIAEENQRRESALNAGKRTDLEKAKDRQASDDPDDPDPGYAQDVADLQKQVDDAEAEIQRDKKRAEDAKTAEEKQLAENARKIYEGHKADLDYQIQSSYRRAGEQRDVDLLERGPEIPGQPGLYRSQPDTARARSTYNAGEDQALDLEHQGRGAQAREVLEGTLARLQKRQFDLLYGGHAEGVDNPLAIDFGQAGVSGQASFHEGDDTAAAIAETNRLIATLIEEIQKLPDKI